MAPVNHHILTMICELLLSVMITGAVEYSPGTMQVEYIRAYSTDYEQVDIRTVHVPTSDYLECWEQPEW